MISEKRLAANRANALRSTGPRTEAGKAASRRNSLKDGYTGEGLVMTAEDAVEVDLKYEHLAGFIEPRNVVEAELVQRMALASVRMERSRRVEEARIEKRRQAVEKRYTRKHKKELEAAVAIFAEDCKRGYALLIESTLGCKHLREQWEGLAALLESRGFWDDEELALAHRLLGVEPGEAHLEDSDVWFLRVHNALARRVDETALEALRKLGHLSDEAFQKLLADMFVDEEPTPVVTLAKLREYVADMISALNSRASDHWSKRERIPYALDSTISLVDSSLDGMRLARYEAMNESAFHRAWNSLQKTRKEDVEARERWLDAQAQNEPNEELSSPDSIDLYAAALEAAEAAEQARQQAPEGAPLAEQPPQGLFEADPATDEPQRRAKKGA